MERGDRVRATAAAMAATRYTPSSKLVVALKGSWFPPRCKACDAGLVEGELFARGSEYSSALCLGCVEPAPVEAAA